jgi:phage gp29-like protein
MGRIVGPDGQPFAVEVLEQELSAPSVSGIRQVWHSSVATGLTPHRLASLLQAAAEGDATDYLTLAEEMEERDLHYASVLGTRKLAILGLPIVVESRSDDPADVELADAVRDLVSTAEFGEMLAHQVDALGKGYAVSEMIWDRSQFPWTPRFVERDPRWFRYDRDTGRELRLLDAADAGSGIPLPPYKFVVHTPRIRSGLPIRGGLARIATVAYMCKAWSWRDWMAFADVYGMPMRVGTYGPNASKDDILKLISAVANLGSDAAAVVPSSTKIEFQQAVQVAGAGDFFEKLVSWWDKQTSKAVLGQTMTADDGASRAQAIVHDGVRVDILNADGKNLANTLQRQVIAPFIALNWGADRLHRAPRVRIEVPKRQDVAALVSALAQLVPLGLKVEQSVVRDRLGIPDPDAGAEVLGAPAVPAQPVPALNRAANAATRQPVAADLIANRLGIEAANAHRSWLDQIREIVDQADSLEDLRDTLLASFAELSDEDMARVMQAGFAVAELVGRFDVSREAA